MPSYSPVFSQPFIQYTAGTPNTTYLVPAGFTAVVRQISIWQNIGGYNFSCFIQDSEAAPGITIAGLNDVGITSSQSIEGRWVVGAGGVIGIYFSELGSEPQAYVGGYLLRNTLT